MLNCHIVRDLLPSYLEHLTSPETEAELTEHLSACPDCRAAKAAMEADLGVEKAPKPRRDFLRRLRWQRRLAALLTLLTAVLCLWGLYRMEYSYTLTSTAEMETVLREPPKPQSLPRLRSSVAHEGRFLRRVPSVAPTLPPLL